MCGWEKSEDEVRERDEETRCVVSRKSYRESGNECGCARHH